jgi:hypothetical protein
MKMYKPYSLLTVLVSAMALTACGGGSDDGSGTGNRTTGVVTSKSASSINVAGSTFSTSSSSVSGDEIGSVDAVDTGMVVSVESDGAGNAVEIEYDAEVEGVVQNIGGGMMVVLGQNVDISQNPNFRSHMSSVSDVNNIPVGAMVEVSGYSDGMGNIIATYVELEDHMADSNDEMELEGIVTALDLDNGTFMIGNQLIHFDPNSISLTMENGLNVEVDLMMVGNDFHATEIEIEDDYGDEHGEGHEIEIEGIVSGDLGTDGTFVINGETVMLADMVEYEYGLTQADIVDGAHLEVEGYLNSDGMLIVHEVEPPGTSDDDEYEDSSDSSDTDSSSDSPDTIL